MPIIAPRPGLDDDDPVAEVHKPLSAQEAQALRERDPSVSVWYVIGWQCVVGGVLGLVAWAVTGKLQAALSAGYGALAVVIPAALFARGLLSRVALSSPGAAVAGFFVWEVVKIALTLAMLFVAPRLLPELNWPAMLVGLVVTMKVYWVALLVRPKKFKPTP